MAARRIRWSGANGSREYRTLWNREAAKQLARRHRATAGALDTKRADASFAASHRQGIVEDFTRLSRALSDVRLEELDPLAVHFEPGAGEGRKGADLPLNLHSRLAPVDSGFSLV